MLVIANMIGAGVFTTSGFALADLGRREYVMLAWLVGGLLAVCGALSYGALARRFPESGGEYLFLSRLFHPLAGFLAGWVSLLAGFSAPTAAAALLFEAYANPSGTLFPPKVLGTGVILVAVLMHGVRLRHGVVLQNTSVALKLLAMGGLIVYGAARFASDGVAPAGEEAVGAAAGGFDPGAFAVTLVWVSFAYSGWNAAVYVAGEVREPERNLHRSLLLGTSVVLVLYLAINAVFVHAAPVAELAGRADIGAVAAGALGGDGLRVTVSYVIALALFTSVSSLVMAGPRVYARMAEDGLFPARFSRFAGLSGGGDVPGAAVALQGALAAAFLWISGIEELLGYIGFTLGASAAVTVAGLIALRNREGPERVPVPGFPWVPGVFVVTTLAAAAYMVVRRPDESLRGLATVALGVPVYWLLRRRSAWSGPS